MAAEPVFVHGADGHPIAVEGQPDDWAGIAWEDPRAALGQGLQYEHASDDIMDRDILLHEPERHRAVGGSQVSNSLYLLHTLYVGTS